VRQHAAPVATGELPPMTRRNATQDLSGSLPKPTQPRRRPRHRRKPRRSSYPFEKAYAVLQDDTDHPVDLTVDAIAAIARIDRRARLLAHHFEEHVDSPEKYRDYEDLRLLQRCMREEAFYDAGHAHGVVAGRLGSREVFSRASAQGRTLLRQILTAVQTSTLPSKTVAALLVEIVRAVVLGLPSSAHRRVRRHLRGRPARARKV
jgi:hypothetical protein